MQRDPRAYLWDVQASALAIQAFTSGMDAAAYANNAMAQGAVERTNLRSLAKRSISCRSATLR